VVGVKEKGRGSRSLHLPNSKQTEHSEKSYLIRNLGKILVNCIYKIYRYPINLGKLKSNVTIKYLVKNILLYNTLL